MQGEQRILVVDDDADVRETLRDIIEKMGNIEVDCAKSGEKGFTWVKERHYDLVLIDFWMPGMDGLELLQRIKHYDATIPVVVLTGFPTVDCAIQTMKDGAADFITKPFRVQQIEHVVRKQLSQPDGTPSDTSARRLDHQDSALDASSRKLNNKIKELAILYSISESMGGADFEVESFYEKVVELASTITGAEKTSLMVLDRDANVLTIKAAKGLSHEIVGSVRLPIGSGVAGRVMTSGKPLLVKKDPNAVFGPQGERKAYKTDSYVSIPLTIKGETFGVLNLTDKCDGSTFDEGEVLLLLSLARKAALNIENSILYESLYNNLINTLQCLVSTLEAKDHYTQKHSERVTNLAVEIAKQMGCRQEEVESLRFAGLLHDIGKIGIHDAVLQKSEGLTKEEFRLVKNHPIVGENIIRPLGLLPMENAVVRNHHERWDGRGYPDGFEGEGIPLLARVLAVADSWDAMISDRPYRAAKTAEAATLELKRCTGSQFDRRVVEAFLQMDPSNLDLSALGQGS